MASPFPGMDPYLEALWGDVHAGMVIHARDAFQSVLPSGLRARVQERVLLKTPGSLEERRLAEIRGLTTRPEKSAAVVEPLLVEAGAEPATETFLEIIDRESGNRVVTVIEFLSPSNKSPDPDQEQYLRKQHEITSSDANLVEIDLNRFGMHTLAFPLAQLKWPTAEWPRTSRTKCGSCPCSVGCDPTG